MSQLKVHIIFKDPYWQGSEIVEVYHDLDEANRQLRDLKDAGEVNDNFYIESWEVQ